MRRLAFAVPLALVAQISPLAAADGERDTSFGGDGIVTWDGGGDVEVADVAVGSAHSAAYAVGSIELPGLDPALHWKGFGATGQDLDSGCAQATSTLVTLGVASSALTGLVDSSGNLLAGGWVTITGSPSIRRALLARFDLSQPGCHLDTSFSSNGWSYFDDESWCDTEECDVVDLVEIRPETGAYATPRIVALVRAEVSIVSSRFFLLGLHANGVIDSSFGTNGWREVTLGGLGPLYPEAHLAVDGTGGLHVLVTRFETGTLDQDVFVLSFLPSGDLAPEPATHVADSGDDDPDDPIGKDIAIGSDGSWYLSFQANPSSATVRVASFAENRADNFEEGTLWHQVVGQGDGKIVSAYDFVSADGCQTARRSADFDAGLPLDLTYGQTGSGKNGYDLDLGGSNGESVVELGLWAGRPLLAGTATDASGSSGFLLRAENAYVFSDGFEEGSPASWSAAPGIVLPE